MAHERLRDDRKVSVFFVCRAHNFPCHLRKTGWRSAIDFAVEELDDLRPALGPPDFGCQNGLPLFRTNGSGIFG